MDQPYDGASRSSHSHAAALHGEGSKKPRSPRSGGSTLRALDPSAPNGEPVMNRSVVPQRRRSVALLLSIAVAITALVVSSGPIAAGHVKPAASGGPTVFVGIHKGPSDVHGSSTYGTVAQLHIPAGRWF